jgi:hypothetical protein
MARILISYGIPKSASTFAWQLIKQIAIEGGLPIATLTTKSKETDTPEDYIDSISEEKLRLIEEDVGDASVVIKTHGDVTPAVARLVADGTAQVFASYRDLRDVALSLVDHGTRSRKEGINDFAEFHRPNDTLETLKDQVQRFENWVELCDPLLISYDEISFDTHRTITRIATRLGVTIDADAIADFYSENKHLIRQFNRGERHRFEQEMDKDASDLFVSTFPRYYSTYFPDELSMTIRASVKQDTTALQSKDIHNMSLTELANHFKSDKGTQSGAPPHRYTYLYDQLFWPVKNKEINFLEIGLAVGGPEVGGPAERTVLSPSVQMWLTYFSKAHIFGFDISDFSHMANPRFTFIRGDVGSEIDLGRLVSAAQAFDVIIDDASHASYHQQLAFRTLFPKLGPGGLYIIEDLHWQSPAFESTLPKVPKTAQFLTSFFEKQEYIQNSLLSADYMRDLRSEVASFASFGAFDGSAGPIKLIVIRKADDPAVRQDVESTLDPAKSLQVKAVSAVSVEELIGIAYKTVLERTPDPPGFQAYRNAFKDVPLGVGLERTLKALLKSQEFQSRQLFKETGSKRARNQLQQRKNGIMFLQTADTERYNKLLNLSSKTIQAFCKKNNFNYESYLGIVRGHYPWQATFNRIPMLYRLAEGGFSDWVCYLDADAFIVDLNFDLSSYLLNKNDVALIAAPIGKNNFWWAVNAGVFFLNLGHPLGRAITREWHSVFSAITDDELRGAVEWSSIPDDQSLLHQVLRSMPDIENHIVIDDAQPPLINYEGRFIKQVLRVAGSLEERVNRLRAEVSRLLDDSDSRSCQG